jgi:hypothetical protein
MDNITVIVEYAASQDVEVVVDYSQPGSVGADGKSAYEISLDNGFEGTESEWLASLQGAGTDISNKVDKQQTINGHALSSKVVITKSDVGLGNADNTADIEKEVSNPQQTAFDLKADIAYVNSQDAAIQAQLPAKAATTYVDAQDTAVVSQLLGSAPTDANTLKKLNDKISALGAFLNGTDVNMDSILELAAAISEDQGLLDALNNNKLNKSDVYNALDLLISGKALDARQGKVLSDLITANTSAISANVTAINSKADATSTTATLALKADATTVTSGLALKADAAAVTASLATKADDAATTTALGLKAPLSNPTFTTGLTVNTSTTGTTQAVIVNTNAGASADSRIAVSNGTVLLSLIIRGTGFTSNANNGFLNLSGTGSLGFILNGTERARILTNGNFGFGVATPTASIHVKAGTTAAGTAPIKVTLTSAALQTAKEPGTFQPDSSGNWYYVKSNSTEYQIANLTEAQTLTNKTLTNPILTGFTVSTLGAGTISMESYVTDALSPTIGSVVVGGGSAKARVWFNGTNWTVTGI